VFVFGDDYLMNDWDKHVYVLMLMINFVVELLDANVGDGTACI